MNFVAKIRFDLLLKKNQAEGVPLKFDKRNDKNNITCWIFKQKQSKKTERKRERERRLLIWKKISP